MVIMNMAKDMDIGVDIDMVINTVISMVMVMDMDMEEEDVKKKDNKMKDHPHQALHLQAHQILNLKMLRNHILSKGKHQKKDNTSTNIMVKESIMEEEEIILKINIKKEIII